MISWGLGRSSSAAARYASERRFPPARSVTLPRQMADLELKRTPGDRRLYVLEGVGTLRFSGFASRTATAEAGGSSWRIARRGFWQRVIQATDELGSAAGEFELRGLRRGGTVRWA